MSDWIFVLEGTAQSIARTTREHADLYDGDADIPYEGHLISTERGFWLRFTPNLPPHEFVNLVCWLNAPPDENEVRNAVGWVTSPGTNRRYALWADRQNEWGDTLLGVDSDGARVRVYVPEAVLYLSDHDEDPPIAFDAGVEGRPADETFEIRTTPASASTNVSFAPGPAPD